jgi:hypothetical protein
MCNTQDFIRMKSRVIHSLDFIRMKSDRYPPNKTTDHKEKPCLAGLFSLEGNESCAK